jgi:hypothetical protein
VALLGKTEVGDHQQQAVLNSRPFKILLAGVVDNLCVPYLSDWKQMLTVGLVARFAGPGHMFHVPQVLSLIRYSDCLSADCVKVVPSKKWDSRICVLDQQELLCSGFLVHYLPLCMQLAISWLCACMGQTA